MRTSLRCGGYTAPDQLRHDRTPAIEEADEESRGATPVAIG